MIHKLAIIYPKAKISPNVKIGPYSIIGANVQIGEGSDIQTIADLISDYQTSIPQRPGEALHSRSNTDRIKEVLQWNYKIKLIDWIKTKFN